MSSGSSDRRPLDLEEAALQRIEALMVSSSPKQAIRSTAPAAPEAAGDRADADGPEDGVKPH
jgi:hypothetical protein